MTPHTSDYDIVIRGGTIVDGTGAPAVAATSPSSATASRRSATSRGAAGRRSTPTAGRHARLRRRPHPHGRPGVLGRTGLPGSCWHGVTTMVMGNCGFTSRRRARGRAELVVRNLERAEDIPAERDRAGHRLDLVDLRRVPRRRRRRAQGTQLRRSDRPLRAAHLGDGRAGLRGGAPPTTSSTSWTASSARRCAAGAIGFTTSRSRGHTTPDGSPVASRLAAWDEVAALVEHRWPARATACSSSPTSVRADPEGSQSRTAAAGSPSSRSRACARRGLRHVRERRSARRRIDFARRGQRPRRRPVRAHPLPQRRSPRSPSDQARLRPPRRVARRSQPAARRAEGAAARPRAAGAARARRPPRRLRSGAHRAWRPPGPSSTP